MFKDHWPLSTYAWKCDVHGIFHLFNFHRLNHLRIHENFDGKTLYPLSDGGASIPEESVLEIDLPDLLDLNQKENDNVLVATLP